MVRVTVFRYNYSDYILMWIECLYTDNIRANTYRCSLNDYIPIRLDGLYTDTARVIIY